jgi:UDP-N-acetylmuramoylalanine--D-glutamate ligase
MENYCAAKERIFARQTTDDFLVLNADNTPCVEAVARAKASVYWFSVEHPVDQGAWLEDGWVVYRSKHQGTVEKIMPLGGIPLKGAHNVENVLAAVVAARLAGASAETIRNVVENFRAVEHRLEYVATRHGVEFYNDSKATNVDATAKAIAAFAGGIHLILGGKDKGSPYTVLADLLRQRVRAIYTIGAAAAKIESELRGVVTIHHCETLAKAVQAAAAAASSGEVVVLAPACASYDQFENYEQRGHLFKQLVSELRD